MLVPEKQDVTGVFAGDGPAPWPYTADDVAQEIARARNLTTLPVGQWTGPRPVSVAMVQGLLSDLAGEGALVVRVAGRWRRLGAGFVIDQRAQACGAVSDDTLMYGRAQDEQAWADQELAEAARLRRVKAEEVALLVLRDRHLDEYGRLVAQTEQALTRAAAQDQSDGETAQARL